MDNEIRQEEIDSKLQQAEQPKVICSEADIERVDKIKVDADEELQATFKAKDLTTVDFTQKRMYTSKNGTVDGKFGCITESYNLGQLKRVQIKNRLKENSISIVLISIAVVALLDIIMKNFMAYLAGALDDPEKLEAFLLILGMAINIGLIVEVIALLCAKVSYIYVKIASSKHYMLRVYDMSNYKTIRNCILKYNEKNGGKLIG